MSSSVLTLPPPPVPSTRRTSGSRRSWAARSAQTIFCQIAASAAPPRTVKSSACSTARRPSSVARPTRQLAGVKPASSSASSYAPTPASTPVSCQVPGVDERVDPLADRAPACGVLPRDALLAAHRVGQGGASLQLVQLRLP